MTERRLSDEMCQGLRIELDAEAHMCSAPFLDDALHDLDVVMGELARYRRAIEVAVHHLDTTTGLWATDQPQAYADAMQDGLDSSAAFDCFQETLHRLDHKTAIAELNAILSLPIPPLLQAQNDLAAAQATIAQQGAVIVAMRETVKKTQRDLYGDLTPEAILRLDAAIGINHATGRDDYSQLVADHDARIRAEVLEQAAAEADTALREVAGGERVGQRIRALERKP